MAVRERRGRSVAPAEAEAVGARAQPQAPLSRFADGFPHLEEAGPLLLALFAVGPAPGGQGGPQRIADGARAGAGRGATEQPLSAAATTSGAASKSVSGAGAVLVVIAEPPVLGQPPLGGAGIVFCPPQGLVGAAANIQAGAGGLDLRLGLGGLAARAAGEEERQRQRAGMVAVTAPQDACLGPAPADAPDRAADRGAGLDARGRPGRAEHAGEGTSALGFMDKGSARNPGRPGTPSRTPVAGRSVRHRRCHRCPA